MGSLEGLIAIELPAVDTFFPRLQQCRKEKNLSHARTLHVHICLHGLNAHTVLGNHLIPVFAKCGSMPLAYQTFLGLEHRNEFAWASLMHGYIDIGDCQQTLLLYQQMHSHDAYPNRYTYSLLLKACSKLKSITHGQKIYMEIIKQGVEIDSFIGNTLVDMYAKCGLLLSSNEIFDGLPARNVVTWNALMTGYEEHGFPKEALSLFEEMKETEIVPDEITSICIIKSCASLGSVEVGQEVHSVVVQEGYEKDAFVGSILIDMYSKCGLLAEARDVFDELAHKDIVIWTSLIAAYAKNGLIVDLKKCLAELQLTGMPLTTFVYNVAMMGYAEQGGLDEALLLCVHMKEQGLLPDQVTFTSILKACSETAGIQPGRSIHAQIQGMHGLKLCETVLLNALIDMYSKCGSMGEAQDVFDVEFSKDIVTWSSLITGYAAQGDFDIVVDLTKRLQEEGFTPDGFVCLSLIAVCSHAGLVNIGQVYFKDTCKSHNVMLNLAHYNCVLDSCIRAGQLDEALAIMRKFPFEPDVTSWSLFLSACRSLSNKEAFDCVASFAERRASPYVLMSSFVLE